MKKFKILIIVVFLILTSVFFAGCTATEKPTTPVDNTPQATQIAVEETAVPEEITGPQVEGELKPGDKVNSTDVFGRNYSWVEYRENITSEMPPNGVVQRYYFSRIERSLSNYNGTPAIRYRSISKGENWEVISDHYIDTSVSNQLGGSIVNIKEGQIYSTENYTAEPLNQENRPFGEKIHTFVYQGTESITVPAGTFPDAKKYIYYNDKNHNKYTYWFATDVPVPVLVQNPNEYIVGYNGFESDELTGWG